MKISLNGMLKNNKKFVILGIAAIVVGCIGGYIAFIYTRDLPLNNMYNQVSNQKNLSTKNIQKSKINQVSKNIDVQENVDISVGTVYDVAHKMTNSLIVADYIWGRVPMTRKRVDKLYYVVENSDLTDRQTLLEMIKRWRKGDFSNIVEDHNYLWDMLRGTIGKAYGQNIEAVEKAEKEFKQ